MLISRKIKQSFIWASLIVLASTILIGLAPVAKTAALTENGQKRLYVAGLATCLYKAHAIDEHDDNITDDIRDYWDNGGDGGNKESAIVGLGLNSSNGIVTCNEIMAAILPFADELGLQAVDISSLQTALEVAIIGGGKDIKSYGSEGIGGDEFESLARNFVTQVINPYFNTLSLTPEDLAERYMPLIDFCFTVRSTPFSGAGDHRFDIPAQGGGTVYFDYKKPEGRAITAALSMDLNNGGPAGTSGAFSTQVGLVDDVLTDYSYDSVKDETPYDWDFYPLGNDFFAGASGFDSSDIGEGSREHLEAGALASCDDIENNKDLLAGQYSVTPDPTSPGAGVLTFDGKTAAEIVSEAPEDVNYNGSEGDNVQSCEGADALGWIACPFITGLLNLSDTIFQSFIVPFLTVDPINTNSGQVYTIWSSFRTVGNVLLVFGLLFIVFGQAIGGGLIDAYTAKKAMPRIFVAAILINLSIYLVAFMVDMGNILGAGVGEMITAPLAASGQDKFVLDGVVGLVTTVGLILVIAIPILIIVLLADTRKGSKNADSGVFKNLTKGVMYFAFFIAIPLLILILSIFFTLILRLGTILFLCIISPVALALFVMPSTDKYAKKWLDLFIKSILVYPIIVAIFAVAAVLGSLLSSSVGGIDFVGLSDGLSNLTDKSAILLLTPAAPLGVLEAFFNVDGPGMLFSIASILVMFAPLAMIPFSFKLAGGLMGSILGIATKGRGGFDKVVRGDKHNPHSRFYSTWGKDGYLGKKFDNNKGVTIKGLGSRLKNIGAKKNPDGSDVFPGEGAPEIDPTTTAAGSTRTQGKKSRRNRFGGYGRNQYGPQAPNPIPTPTTPVLPSRRPKESGAVNLDETSSSRDSVSVTGTVTSTTNPTPWRTPGGQGYAPPMGGGDELTTPLEVGARPRVVLPQQEQPGAYPETAGAVPRVQTQQNQPASILVRPTATRRGESDGGIILPSDKDINVYGRQSVAENDRFKDDTSTPTSPAQ